MHDLQVYGVILAVVLCLIVFGGVKIINKVSPAFLIPVIVSLFSIFIGIFTARGGGDPRMTSHLHILPAPLCCIVLVQVLIRMLEVAIIAMMDSNGVQSWKISFSLENIFSLKNHLQITIRILFYCKGFTNVTTHLN